MSSQKKYLTLGNKIGYGSGEMAGNLLNGLVNNFYMLYLTDTVGLNVGIVGTLMALSKLLDGVSDVLFGTLIDKTHSKMGKARPWMLYSQIGVSLCLALLFSIPAGFTEWAKYAWFFVFYLSVNAIFYTANNVSYSTLMVLITKNGDERVQLGVFRFAFVMITQLIVSTTGLQLSRIFGWSVVAIIFAVLGLVINTISVFSVRELPEEELLEGDTTDSEAKKSELTLWKSIGLLIKNPFYIIMLLMNICTYLVMGAMGSAVYFFKDVMGNEDLYSVFMIAMMAPMLIGLALTPMVVKKFGMYKTNFVVFLMATVFRALLIIAGLMGNFPLMLVSIALSNICAAPLTADGNALVGAISDYTYKKERIRIDGSMYSCTSMGIKVGNALGTAMLGWLLQAGHYDGTLAVQPDSALAMISFVFLWVPFILYFIVTVLNYFLKVEKANKELDALNGVEA